MNKKESGNKGESKNGNSQRVESKELIAQDFPTVFGVIVLKPEQAEGLQTGLSSAEPFCYCPHPEHGMLYILTHGNEIFHVPPSIDLYQEGPDLVGRDEKGVQFQSLMANITVIGHDLPACLITHKRLTKPVLLQ